MRRTSGIGTIVLGLTVAMAPLVVGAGVSGAAGPTAAARVGGATPTHPAGSPPLTLTTAQVISALATEGVGVYASPSSTSPIDPVTAPAVPLQILKSQAVVDAAETHTKGGTAGADLDALAPMPTPPAGKAYAPYSYLLAAYATATATPGEVLAGRVLGAQDWSHADGIAFPDLVLTLFTADALRAAATPNGPAAVGAVVPGPGTSLCADLADWVSQRLNAAVKAVKVAQSSNAFLGFVGGLWNSAVDLAVSVIPNVVTTLTAPVTSTIQTGISAVGVGAGVVSLLRNLSANETASPAANSFGVDPEGATTGPGKTGTVTVTVGNPAGFDWPSGLTQCAGDLGVTLPSLNAVDGATVAWTMTPVDGVPTDAWCLVSDCPLATEDTGSTQTTVQSDHTAAFAYDTNTELADQDARGAPISGPDSILVKSIVTLDTAKLKSLVKGLVLAAVPGGVKIVTGPLVSLLTSEVFSEIDSLTQPTAFRYVLIEHHEIPAEMPATSCGGLLSIGDFPGANKEMGGSQGELSSCIYYLDTNEKNPPPAGGELSLFSWDGCTVTLDCVNLAETSYEHLAGQGSSVQGLGDQGWTAEKTFSCGKTATCPESLAGARVGNYDFEVVDESPGGSAEELAAKVVSELCPDCKFPTSPSPTG